MPTDPSFITTIEDRYFEVSRDLAHQSERLLIKVAPRFAGDAQMYIVNGVARRIGTISRCLENIFELFPMATTEPLDRDTLSDISINLHAFVIAIVGIQDNLAWAFLENVGHKIPKNGIGLFKVDTQKVLPQTIIDHLNKPGIRAWHDDYVKDFRDSLAHRIPLYVPPYLVVGKKSIEQHGTLAAEFEASLKQGDFQLANQAMDAQTMLGEACPFFLHSHRSACVPLHPQLVDDARKAEQIVNLFVEEWTR